MKGLAEWKDWKPGDKVKIGDEEVLVIDPEGLYEALKFKEFREEVWGWPKEPVGGQSIKRQLKAKTKPKNRIKKEEPKKKLKEVPKRELTPEELKNKYYSIYRAEKEPKLCVRCGENTTINHSNKYCEDCKPYIHTRGKFIIFERDGFKCVYCGKSAIGESSELNSELHVDHVYPKSRGGEDKAKNLVTAYKECNLAKKDHILSAQDEILEKINKRNKANEIDPELIIIIHAGKPKF